MFYLVAPSVVVLSTSVLLASGCAKGRDDARRPNSSDSNRASNRKNQSGMSSRKPGTSSKSSRRDPNSSKGAIGVGGVKKSYRSKREGGSSKSGRTFKSAKPLAVPKKAGANAGAAGVVAKVDTSSRLKRRSEKEKSIEGSQRPSERSKRSSRNKKSTPKKELQVDKTQEMSGEDKEVPVKAAISPKAVSVTVRLPSWKEWPVEGVAKHEIRIEPSELRWKAIGGIQNVAVHNHSNAKKAIKIKCSDNLLYRVNPVHALIPAGGSVRVDILRQNGIAKVDKIVIIAVDAGMDDHNPREVLTRSINTDMMVLPLIATAAN